MRNVATDALATPAQRYDMVSKVMFNNRNTMPEDILKCIGKPNSVETNSVSGETIWQYTGAQGYMEVLFSNGTPYSVRLNDNLRFESWCK